MKLKFWNKDYNICDLCVEGHHDVCDVTLYEDSDYECPCNNQYHKTLNSVNNKELSASELLRGSDE